MERNPRLRVEIWDDNHVIAETLADSDVHIPDNVEREVRVFLGDLVQSFWKKFALRDIEVQLLLAKKVGFNILLSDEYVRDYQPQKKHILEHFHHFELEVKDLSCNIDFEEPTTFDSLHPLLYLDGRYNERAIDPAKLPQRNDYLIYVLKLTITALSLTKWYKTEEREPPSTPEESSDHDC